MVQPELVEADACLFCGALTSDLVCTACEFWLDSNHWDEESWLDIEEEDEHANRDT